MLYKDLFYKYLSSVTVTSKVWIWHTKVWLPVKHTRFQHS